jgi:hypothetical protein
MNNDLEIKVGDETNIWCKPNSNEVNLYAKGSVGGNGLIGNANNKFISQTIENTENLFVENEIVGFTKDYIDLKINMFIDKQAVEEMKQNAEDDWLNKMLSKYNPKSTWTLRFFSETKLVKENLNIKSIEKENLKNYYLNNKDLIWLENKEGEKLNAENTAYTEDNVKTFRAINSNVEIEIKSISKDRNYYTLEIGKKNAS